MSDLDCTMKSFDLLARGTPVPTEHYATNYPCEATAVMDDFRYETKAFYANVVLDLLRLGLYGPEDIRQIAKTLTEDYKAI
jgi:hypothetical protein